MTKLSKPIPEVLELGTAIFAHRLRIKDVMKEAGLGATTWTRWTRGGDAKASSLAAVRQAIAALSIRKEET